MKSPTIQNNDLKNILITKNQTILESYRRLNDTGYRVLICVEAGKLFGIVTDSDIRRGILANKKLEDTVETIVNRHPVVASSDMSEKAILALMKEKKVDPIPVINDRGDLLNIYSLTDLTRSLVLPNSAVIVAGGFGKRLMPMTHNTPKPLLTIGGKPIIEHVIEHIAQYGIESFYVTVNYKSEMVKQHLGDGKQLGLKINYLEETKQLGTVGAISLLRNHNIEFPFIVMNGDILTRLNFGKLLDAHKANANLLTVCLTNYRFDVPYGVVEVDEGRITAINEKPVYNFFINAGIYCMSPAIIELIKPDTYFDVTSLMNLLMVKKIPIGYFVIDEYWRDVGSPEDYFHANQDYNNGGF